MSKLEKYYVYEDLDEVSLSVLKNIITDKNVLRAEKEELRKKKQVDY